MLAPIFTKTLKGLKMDQQNQVQDTRELDAIVFAAFVRAQKKFGKALKSSANPYFKNAFREVKMCSSSTKNVLSQLFQF